MHLIKFRGYQWLIWAFYFLFLVSIATFVNDIGVNDQINKSHATINQIIKSSPWGDPTYFATAAIDVVKHGWVTNDSKWVFNLWPPGFVLLEATIIKIFGQECSIIFILQLLASFLFSICLVLLNKLLRQWMSGGVAFILPLSVFIFPFSRLFFLEPHGIIFGESFACSTFLIGFLFFLFAYQKQNTTLAIFSGLFLGLSTYFRSNYEVFLSVLSITGLLGASIIGIIWKFKSLEVKNNSSPIYSFAKIVLFLIISAQLLTMPWRMYQLINNHNIKWVQTSYSILKNLVTKSEDLIKDGAGWIDAGVGNNTCRIDPNTCGQVKNSKKLLLKTFFNHPLHWYSYKLQAIGDYWFSSPNYFAGASPTRTFQDVFFNGVLLFMFSGIFILMLLPVIVMQPLYLPLLWFNISVFFANVLIFSVAHFEVRYFFFIKTYIVVSFFIYSALFLRYNKYSFTR